MSAEVIPLLAQRRIEAAALAGVYRQLTGPLGEDRAVDAIRAAVEAAAVEAGRAFARQAPGGPSLAHFATVVDRWRQGGALAVDGPRLRGNVLELTVTRCRYVELYRSMGVPDRLAPVLSCARDAAFARGYHPALELDRSPTLADGAPACRFRFTWGRGPGA